VRSTKAKKIQRKLGFILDRFKKEKEIKLAVDVDPINFN